MHGVFLEKSKIQFDQKSNQPFFDLVYRRDFQYSCEE